MKILVAEDDATSLFMLQSLLMKWGYDVIAASDGQEALSVLTGEDPPLLAILDWMLPGESGPEICRKLASRGLLKEDGGRREEMMKPYQYVIILTVKGEKENVVAGLEAGADDYITKPFDAHELKMRLMVGRRILDLQEKLRNAALYDALTGLLNRRAVIERLEQELCRASRNELPLSVALLDIDHFKEVNDTYGHASGDAVLVESARRIKASVRPYDIVGRYGGEEFLMVFPGAKGGALDALCERVRNIFQAAPFYSAEHEGERSKMDVTASIGICENNKEFDTVDSILAEADRAMYRAKKKGRNLVSR
jgi:diguanylate cyclase (GGDEF)-like protein